MGFLGDLLCFSNWAGEVFGLRAMSGWVAGWFWAVVRF